MTIHTICGSSIAVDVCDQKHNKYHCLRLVFFSLLTFAMSLAVADAETEKRAYHIERQAARTALNLYAELTGLQLGFDLRAVEDVVTNAVNGEYESAQALTLLLKNTGLYADYGVSGIYIRKIATEEFGSGVEAPPPSNASTNALRLTAIAATATQQTAPSVTGGGATSERTQPGQELDNIIVTGTSLRGVTNPASPVLVFDREDIERAGQTELSEFIQTIPQNFQGGLTDAASTVPGGTEPGNFGSGTGANLRGLGAESTLVLVNGRRLAPAGIASFTDLSTIPLSAVQRVEVVTDGSSAIYGSDAIGGVINVILREELDGAETTVRYGRVTTGDRYEVRASQALGTSWGSGNVLANYEYFTETPLRSTDRSFTESSAVPFDLSSDSESHAVFVSGSQAISEGVSLFGTGQYATRDTVTSTTTAAGFPTNFEIETKQYGAVLGLEVEMGDSWQAEVSTTYNEYENDNTQELPTIDFSSSVNIVTDVLSWDVKADGNLFSVEGGDVKLALGGGYREEAYEISETKNERDVAYVFGEALLPLVGTPNAKPWLRSLEISAALRHEDYSDAGSSTDGKLGIVWSPTDELQLRGTIGTSFRAPLLSESAAGPNFTFVQAAPDPLSSTGTSIGMFLGGRALSEAAPELGTALKPEEAEIYTLGFDFSPASLPGFYVSVTYFNIDFTDRIAAPPLDIFNVLADPAFGPLVTRNPTAEDVDEVLQVTTNLLNFSGIPNDELGNGGIGFIYDRRDANLTRTKNAGFDFDIGYSRDIEFGVLGANLAGSYLTELEDQLTSEAPFLDALNRYLNPVDLRLRGSLSWSHAGWQMGFFVNHTDAYRDDRTTPDTKIGSFTTYDLTVQYAFEDSAIPSLLHDMRLSFGALNLFDEDPPFVDNTTAADIVFNFDVRNASAMGRLLTFQLSKPW